MLKFSFNFKVNFFKSDNAEENCEIVDGEDGILFVHYPDGRSTGDAFVMFTSVEELDKVLLKHKKTMGTRYIELFKSTPAELHQVLKKSQDTKFYQNNLKDIPITPLQILPPEMISGYNKKDCVRVKDLPTDAGIEVILEFFGVHSQQIVQQGVHMILNSENRPSGEAFIQMTTEYAAHTLVHQKNAKALFYNGNQFIIHIIQCSGEEMNLVLMGLLPLNFANTDQNVLLPCSPQPNSKEIKILNDQNKAHESSIIQPIPVNTATPQNNYIKNSKPVSNTTPNLSQLMPYYTTLPPFCYSSIGQYQYQGSSPILSPPLQQYPYLQQITSNIMPSTSNIYLTPTISAMSSMNVNQCLILMKGVPINVTCSEIAQFFDGFYNVKHSSNLFFR
jgi:hypothetical protein